MKKFSIAGFQVDIELPDTYLKTEEHAEIFMLSAAGYNQAEIAEMTGIKESMVSVKTQQIMYASGAVNIPNMIAICFQKGFCK